MNVFMFFVLYFSYILLGYIDPVFRRAIITVYSMFTLNLISD